MPRRSMLPPPETDGLPSAPEPDDAYDYLPPGVPEPVPGVPEPVGPQPVEPVRPPGPRCEICERALGKAHKVHAVYDGNGAFCPVCFVHEIAAKDSERFHDGRFGAVFCAMCGFLTVTGIDRQCGECGAAATTTVPRATP